MGATRRVGRRFVALVPLLLLGGCGPKPSDETITLAMTPGGFCFGDCGGYAVRLGPDGRGLLITGDQRRRAFRATPDQVTAFQRRLRPYRPDGARVQQGERDCARTAPHGAPVQIVSDAETYDVRWSSPSSGAAHLRWYAGCRPDEHKAMLDALKTTPETLPIGALLAAR